VSQRRYIMEGSSECKKLGQCDAVWNVLLKSPAGKPVTRSNRLEAGHRTKDLTRNLKKNPLGMTRGGSTIVEKRALEKVRRKKSTGSFRGQKVPRFIRPSIVAQQTPEGKPPHRRRGEHRKNQLKEEMRNSTDLKKGLSKGSTWESGDN